MQDYTALATPKPLPSPYEDADPLPPTLLERDNVVQHLTNPPRIAQNITSSDSLSSSLKDVHLAPTPVAQNDAGSITSSRNVPNSPPVIQSTSPIDTSTPSDALRSKKVNPFEDLLETETVYVETLSGIIRKVAGAWSRSNLPPTELDQMFRAVESVFKANRSFLARLKEIKANPSSPRAIGDLLMKWLDQLEAPYSSYCSSYLTGFDEWEPVRSNQRLQPQLEAFSASIVPPGNATYWTLDDLLSLPRTRTRYYLKLYGRLLKNSTTGKSTDRKLLEAVAKLENLLGIAEERSKISLMRVRQTLDSADEVVVNIRENDNGPNNLPHDAIKQKATDILDTNSDEPKLRKEDLENITTETVASDRPSTESSTRRSQTSLTLDDLESRLSTKRCLDLFTMNPRIVRLSLAPLNLPYAREIILSTDVSIQFTPKSTGVTVTHRHGHVFLLTDLLLVCEYISAEEKVDPESRADIWLCYPPLAAARLLARPLNENLLEIMILRKETMLLQFDSASKRDTTYSDFQRTIDAAATLGHLSKQSLPPTPSTSAKATLPENENQMRATTILRPENPSTFASGPVPIRASSRGPNYGSQGINGIPANLPEEPHIQFTRQLSPPRSAEIVLPLSVSRARGPGLPNVPRAFAGETKPQNIGPIHSPPLEHRMAFHQSHTGLSTQRQPTNEWSSSKHVGAISMNAPVPQNGAMNSAQDGMLPVPARVEISVGSSEGPGNMGQILSMDSNDCGPFRGHILNPTGIKPCTGILPMDVNRSNSNPSLPNLLNQPSSSRSIRSQFEHAPKSAPPIPVSSEVYPPIRVNSLSSSSNEGGYPVRPVLPSAALPHINSPNNGFNTEQSPPASPTENERRDPVESIEIYKTKCKIFLQQQHAQWKSLGSAKLTLYEGRPTLTKQLVAVSEKDKSMMISTIVLTDGVERVGKTGVAVEISNAGAHTGIVYMIQLRNDKSAGELFEKLLAGSDRGGFKGS